MRSNSAKWNTTGKNYGGATISHKSPPQSSEHPEPSTGTEGRLNELEEKIERTESGTGTFKRKKLAVGDQIQFKLHMQD